MTTLAELSAVQKALETKIAARRVTLTLAHARVCLETVKAAQMPAAPVATGPRLNRVLLAAPRVFLPAELAQWGAVWWYRPQDGNGCTLNNERQWYLNKNYAPTAHHRTVEVIGDALVITAKRTPDDIRHLVGYDADPTLHQTKGHVEAISGLRHGRDHLQAGYGYYEAEMMLSPFAQGQWPAFWFMPMNDALPEIDVLEAVTDPTVIHQTLHTKGAAGERVTMGKEYHRIDGADGFHRYGVLIQPDAVVFYVDDVETHRRPGCGPGPFYPIFNLAFGGSWPEWNTPANLDALPITMKVRSFKAHALA